MSIRDAPNPLRPYYIPPSIGVAPDVGGYSKTSAASTSGIPSAGTQSTFSSARNILSDLDYNNILPDASPSAIDTLKQLTDQALWKYTSVLLAQPFEVAKTILQCCVVTANDSTTSTDDRRRPVGGSRNHSYRDDPPSDDSDSDEIAYFTSAAPTPEPLATQSRRHGRTHNIDYNGRDDAAIPATSPSPHKLQLRSPDSLLEVISQLWQKEGAWGVWKGSNATFIYNVLFKTLEGWIKSLIAAVLNVPDPGLLVPVVGVGNPASVIDSPNPLAHLGIAVAAAGIVGVVLAPLDMARIRLILTPTSHGPRSVLATVRDLPSAFCPTSLLPITLLHSTLPTIISTSTPIILRSRLGIDPILSPTSYSILTFLSSTAELFLRLPLETVLRRGQIHTALGPSTTAAATTTTTTTARGRGKQRPVELDTIADLGPYKGIVGTMWSIVKEEESGAPEVASKVERADAVRRGRRDTRKGQGVEGLWRGWRVGMWGLVGVWGAGALGGVGKGSEF